MFFEFYESLVSEFPDGCDQLLGQPLAADNSLWLSVDGDTCPSLLFSVRRDAPRSDIELRSISIRFSRDCVIEDASGVGASGIYTIVRLNENDPDIIRMFLRVFEESFRVRGRYYTNKEISIRILELADLFEKVEGSIGDVVGLWGELYILSRSSNLAAAVHSWCCHKKAKYDYVADGFVLEAKTTVRSKRKHRFSLEQLRPAGGFSVYVASLAVVEVNSGKSASEFMDELCIKISDDELRARFLAQCLVKGGRDIYRNSLKLSAFPDQTSLVMFSSLNIPVPEVGQALPIENVRFDVDLTGIAPISSREMDEVLEFGKR
ncbi:PD-(D/E)XK motif protein [Halomonas alkalicola]|uniref:PD-(D/E)XK motif protein n=1 Tax=Halomonas alkalicola TaxID=1930622 RepID=A0ABY9H3C1_9GAMM|nr:PD-(D/E)XK motif protein [Halomonas alkalicola]WLI72627.1 PD-(D/E)XK motif protein [Halomonas alkalicola]